MTEKIRITVSFTELEFAAVCGEASGRKLTVQQLIRAKLDLPKDPDRSPSRSRAV